MPYYNRDPKKEHSFDNHPVVNMQYIMGPDRISFITMEKVNRMSPFYGYVVRSDRISFCGDEV